VTVALIVLTFGFFLLLFGANPDAAFAEWVYRSLDRVMAPFRALLESIQLNGESVLDVSVLFAMIVYGIVAMALRALIDWLTSRVDLIRTHEAQAAVAQTPRDHERRPDAGAAPELAENRTSSPRGRAAAQTTIIVGGTLGNRQDALGVPGREAEVSLCPALTRSG
jgi:uncharacterized protein YggT (Ycf19 family)